MASPDKPASAVRRPRLSRMALLLAGTVGATAGVGGYTFTYAKGMSYFSTDPRACANCHIMRPQLASWQASSHHQSAVCIDCHLPHSFVDKYLAKAENGWRHSKEFTAQTFAEPIALKPASKEILQANCVRCHESLVDSITHARGEADSVPDCIHCHAGAGHGERAALGGPYKGADASGPTERESP